MHFWFCGCRHFLACGIIFFPKQLEDRYITAKTSTASVPGKVCSAKATSVLQVLIVGYAPGSKSAIYSFRVVVLLSVDSEVGAACASGDGDEIMKHCPCYRVVQLMSFDPSLSPTDACTRVVRDICDRGRRRGQAAFELGLIAMNMKVFQTCSSAWYAVIHTGWLKIKYPTRQYAISLQPVVTFQKFLKLFNPDTSLNPTVCNVSTAP